MKNRLLALLLFAISFSAVGQRDTTYKYKLCATGGLFLQKNFYGELGIMHPHILMGGSCEDYPIALLGYKLAAEYNFSGSNPIIAPKAAIEYSIAFITLRGNFIDFISRNSNELSFTPEVGLNLLRVVTLCYGWNIPLSHSSVSGIDAHRFSLNFNIPLNFNLFE
jgi:hypothetical protein